ncbi:MAG: transcriptional regulator, partial [Brevundimonas sp.]|nr:transcriptional regulator [Brevundimonas sp.]
GDARMTLGLRFGAEHFLVTVVDGALTVLRTETDGAEVVVAGSPEAVAAAVYGGAGTDGLAIKGRREVFDRFVGFFELPPKAD